MAQVVLDALSKSFPGPGGQCICAIDSLSLSVEDKELLVLVGPSGCGKTTTLRVIAGLEKPEHGTVSIEGQIVNDLRPQDRDIAMVFQNYALYPHMSAFDNVAFGLKLRKYPKPEIEQRVRQAAELLDLSDCLDRKPDALSGGQRQRVAVARAIVRRPQVFLFDEPLSNLDTQMRLQMRTEIARLHSRLGSTMIYVTHDQDEAMALGTRIAVMKAGVLLQVGPPLEIYEHPANQFVARFIGSPPMNLFDGAIIQKGTACFFEEQSGPAAAGTKPFVIPLEPGLAAKLQGFSGKTIVLGIRPEHIRLNSSDTAAGCVEAIAELMQPLGSETHLHLARGAQPFVVRLASGQRVALNQQVSLSFQMENAHFFDSITKRAIV
jgi:multiple sugar transport system ATP-binding protein